MNPTTLTRLAGALRRHMRSEADVEPRLRDALEQLTAHPGKLIRAGLVYTAARHFGLGPSAAERLACGVEYFHVASLALDDLPCMDDATMRRGLPCVHRQHGDATAILAALTLINRAYALIAAALAAQPRRVRTEAAACLDRSLGVAGLVGGQAWDLAFAATDRSARTVSRIAARKTGALFALALLLPATLARPSAAERRALHALCVYWGQLFQVADDLRDVLANSFDAGKTTGRDRPLARPNLANALGVAGARRRMARLAAQAEHVLTALELHGGKRWGHLRAASLAFRPALALPEPVRTAA